MHLAIMSIVLEHIAADEERAPPSRPSLAPNREQDLTDSELSKDEAVADRSLFSHLA